MLILVPCIVYIFDNARRMRLTDSGISDPIHETEHTVYQMGLVSRSGPQAVNRPALRSHCLRIAVSTLALYYGCVT